MATLNSLSLLFSPKLTHSSSILSPLSTSQSSLLSFSLTSKSVVLSATPSHYSVAVGEDLPVDYGEWFPKHNPGDRRRAGVLLHPTSFRGPYGIGDLGGEAFRFIDWLHDAGCSVWQVLPLVPPGRKANEEGSPYSGQDANCGNTLLISLEELVKDGLLTEDELPRPTDADRVDFSVVAELKDPLIAKPYLLFAIYMLLLLFPECCVWAYALTTNLISLTISLVFPFTCWLEDAAYFAAIDNSSNSLNWYEWPEPLKNRHLAALEEVYQSKKDFIDIFIAQQFLFQKQWQKVRNYAREKGISIMGDMPIYVGYHSADVWANKKHFLLLLTSVFLSQNRNGFPLLVSGVPPDAFSETGQLWDSPLYDWKAMEKDGYSWWIRRIRQAQEVYDEFRIDHFRGFAGFWAVPSEAKIAMVGKWKVGPGKSLFDAISRAVGKINIIAEDLGVITEDVVQLRKSIGAPGMAVLQFGFGSDACNPHLPHNHEPNQVVYTGTHDNDTIRGWWDVLKQEEKSNVLKYLSINEENDIQWELIKAAISSVARTAVIPMQDILGLGNSARMNVPATQFGNWSWRLPSSLSFDHLEDEATRLKDLLSTYGRL
ncbi:hypothetical protein SADUNF_Sadunf07G0073700 [Salix dunnii]|uniref:4-alpha-glucanotransferase n=1 Tax=Salix dunnii TaxID=1413687 RepID=A0A835MVX1_9ROSI|nr:hypothetical protein SADUNF_Sadunf07G0073700 [Salix dunnii]